MSGREQVDQQLDPTGQYDGERQCYEHVVHAAGLKDGQNAFFNATPSTLNATTFLFGGKCHTDSPPMGLAEKVTVRMRYANQEDIQSIVAKFRNALPLRNNRVIYFGWRFEYAAETPELVPTEFEMPNNQKVKGWSADFELVCCLNLFPLRRS